MACVSDTGHLPVDAIALIVYHNVWLVGVQTTKAVEGSAQWKNFVANHQERYSQEFARMIEELKKAMK